jgi:hypothetical protein
MVLLIGQIPTRDDRAIIAQPPAPIVPNPTADRGWTDTGIAIAVCIWVLRQGWGLFTQQQGAEAKVTQAVIAAVIKQNEILISALVKREP